MAENRSLRTAGTRLSAMTIDVEDYFHVSAFAKEIRRDQWNTYPCRVVSNTNRLLDLLDRHDVKATFFVLGWVGHRYPELVRRIHARGHEIASHGYWHRLVYEQSIEEFRRDIQESRDVLVDAIGERIAAYRAPSFSITRQSLWARDVLVEEGFSVDSSIVPARHDRYGIPGARGDLHQVTTSAGSLWEFPMPVAKLGWMTVPVGGGGYFRLYPLHFTLNRLARISRERPFVFYLHPWEIDPQQPRIRCSILSRIRHYKNLATTESKLEVLLRTFRFGRLCDVIEEAQPRPEIRSTDKTASREVVSSESLV